MPHVMHNGASAAVPCCASMSSVDERASIGAGLTAASSGVASIGTLSRSVSGSISSSVGDVGAAPYDVATVAARSSAVKMPSSAR
jgi:hypothetical protein